MSSTPALDAATLGAAAATAERIKRYCADAYTDPAGYVNECNWFAWRVVTAFSTSHGFGALRTDQTADQMIAIMKAGSGWTALTGAANAVTDAAMQHAKDDDLVIAGMTAAELGNAAGPGHLAVVVSGPGQYSATAGRNLPSGYAGSANMSARIPRTDGAQEKFGLGWSFPAACWASIKYWWRAPDTSPP